MDPRQLPGPRRILRSALPEVTDLFALRTSLLTHAASAIEVARTVLPGLPARPRIPLQRKTDPPLPDEGTAS